VRLLRIRRSNKSSGRGFGGWEGFCLRGQEYTFEDARAAAQSCLEKLAGDQEKKA